MKMYARSYEYVACTARHRARRGLDTSGRADEAVGDDLGVCELRGGGEQEERRQETQGGGLHEFLVNRGGPRPWELIRQSKCKP